MVMVVEVIIHLVIVQSFIYIACCGLIIAVLCKWWKKESNDVVTGTIADTGASRGHENADDASDGAANGDVGIIVTKQESIPF